MSHVKKEKMSFCIVTQQRGKELQYLLWRRAALEEQRVGESSIGQIRSVLPAMPNFPVGQSLAGPAPRCGAACRRHPSTTHHTPMPTPMCRRRAPPSPCRPTSPARAPPSPCIARPRTPSPCVARPCVAFAPVGYHPASPARPPRSGFGGNEDWGSLKLGTGLWEEASGAWVVGSGKK